MRNVDRHHQFSVTLFLAVLILLFSSCKHNPTGPTDDRPLISSSDYSKVVLKLTNYDVVGITHEEGLDLRSSTVVRIDIGVKTPAGFARQLSSSSTYDAVARAYVIHFQFTVQMDSSKINAPLTIRYVSVDSSYSDIDTTVALYKYPYSSAEIFADSSNLGNNPRNIDGISLSGSTFYFHPLNEGLFAYDPASLNSTACWTGYYRGSHIAADSDFVFCDITHQSIARYNLTTNTADIPLPDLGSISFIGGMATYNHSLFVLVYGLYSTYLERFNLDGVLLDSLSYPSSNSYFMAIYDSVIYCKDEASGSQTDAYQISRFDLRTRSFLSNVLAPAREIEPIAIQGNQLYYCNRFKNFVGVMPIADLVQAIVPTHTSISRVHVRAPNQLLKLTAGGLRMNYAKRDTYWMELNH
jgi:hypothetical protein